MSSAKIHEPIQSGDAAKIEVLRVVREEILKLDSLTAFHTFREGLMDDLGKTIDNSIKIRFPNYGKK